MSAPLPSSGPTATPDLAPPAPLGLPQLCPTPASWRCEGSQRRVRVCGDAVVSVVTLKTIDHELNYREVQPTGQGAIPARKVIESRIHSAQLSLHRQARLRKVKAFTWWGLSCVWWHVRSLSCSLALSAGLSWKLGRLPRRQASATVLPSEPVVPPSGQNRHWEEAWD